MNTNIAELQQKILDIKKRELDRQATTTIALTQEPITAVKISDLLGYHHIPQIQKGYYVYEHLIDGVVFYVGKGKKLRAYDVDTRSLKWHTLRDNQPYAIRFVAYGLVESDAVDIEQHLIWQYAAVQGLRLANQSVRLP